MINNWINFWGELSSRDIILVVSIITAFIIGIISLRQTAKLFSKNVRNTKLGELSQWIADLMTSSNQRIDLLALSKAEKSRWDETIDSSLLIHLFTIRTMTGYLVHHRVSVERIDDRLTTLLNVLEGKLEQYTDVLEECSDNCREYGSKSDEFHKALGKSEKVIESINETCIDIIRISAENIK